MASRYTPVHGLEKLCIHSHGQLKMVRSILTKLYIFLNCNILIVTNTTIVRQRFGKHVLTANNRRGVVHC
jgi:hypothetical protein